jgi:hypothetical protein
MAKSKANQPVEAMQPKPTLYLTGDEIIEGLDVDEKVVLTVKGVCVSKSIDTWSKERKPEQRIEITEVVRAPKSAMSELGRKAQSWQKGAGK